MQSRNSGDFREGSNQTHLNLYSILVSNSKFSKYKHGRSNIWIMGLKFETHYSLFTYCMLFWKMDVRKSNKSHLQLYRAIPRLTSQNALKLPRCPLIFRSSNSCNCGNAFQVQLQGSVSCPRIRQHVEWDWKDLLWCPN